MDDDDDSGDVFRIPNLWGPSRYHREEELPPSFLFSELKCDELNDKLPSSFLPPQVEDGFFALHDLSFITAGNVPTPSTSTGSTNSDEALPEENENEPEDFWMGIREEALNRANFLSWDAFEDQVYNEPQTSYITEAGPDVFDAALVDASDVLRVRNTEHIIIKSHVYAAALLALGLGRSSVLFSWDEEKKSFLKTIQPIRISGYTGETVDGLLEVFMSCGNVTKALQSFVDRTYQTHKSPGRIALADAISTLLSTLQSRLNTPLSSSPSFLQLQALFKPAEALLTSFHLIVKSVAFAETDEAMLSQLFNEVQRQEHRTDSMREILLEILARVSRPFLDFTGEWIGIQREAGVPMEKKGFGKSYIKVEDRTWIDEQGLEMQEPDFVLDSARIPSFLQPEDAQNMFETGKSLRFLRTHHSDHPLARADVILAAHPPALEWKFSWLDIEQIEAKAVQYENDLIAAIKQHSKASTEIGLPPMKLEDDRTDLYRLSIFGKPKEDVEAHFLTSIALLNKPMREAQTADKLSIMLSQTLTSDGHTGPDEEAAFAPPISLIPFLSFGPVIAAQARVVNGTSMRLFFQIHQLREHLSIQRRFQLLGDGVFSSRLSHALFDPELETAERKAGVARTGGIVGLRLEARDSWPPASSELRLALMGVLTESYTSTSSGGGEHAGSYLDRKKELPGDLSFAVREMSEEEIEKCREPNSVEALDFLRLSYKPPPPLEAVITPLSLYKYDQLFKLLLRIVRMLFVVTQLFRDAIDRTSYWQGIDTTAQRFRIEAHHFITCVSSYFFDTGINATWRIFERKLDQIEERINKDVDHTVLGQHEGLDKLREYHERVLDRIMFALLLRKRQQPVMKLLEDIFTTILQFAKHSRSRALGVTRKVGQDPEVKEMYLRFRRKVEVFITVCRGLSEKKGYGEKRALENKTLGAGGLFDAEELAEENTIVQLLARLEMSNYYSRPVNL